MKSKNYFCWLGLVMLCLLIFNGSSVVAGENQSGRLVNYFPALDEQSNDPITSNFEKLTSQERAVVPFEIIIPELEGWFIKERKSVYHTTYTQRYFQYVRIEYRKDGHRLGLFMGVSDPFAHVDIASEVFTYQGVEVRSYEYSFPIVGKGLQKSKIYRWQRGELKYGIILELADFDERALLEDCIDQLHVSTLNSDNLVGPRKEDDIFVWRGPIEKLQPHLGEQAVDLAQVGSFRRRDPVIYMESYGARILRIEYEDKSKLVLRQSEDPDYGHSSRETVERAGITVHLDSTTYPDYRLTSDHEFEEYMKTTYELAWKIDGKYLLVSGEDEDQLWKFFVIINAVLR